MSKESESYRLQMLRHLEQKYGETKPPEVQEAERVIAKFSQEKEKAGSQIARLRAKLPEQDLCPKCWFLDGHKHPFDAATADDPDRYDRMICRTCGYHEDREA